MGPLDPPVRRAPGRWPAGHFILLAIASPGCAALLLFFFCPRFILWRGLSFPEAWFNPEVNRAVDVLAQLRHPLVKVANPSNAGIIWRLFFPVLGRCIRLPETAFLLLPHLGCLLVLGMILHLVYARTRDALYSVLAALVLGSASWFFVSMGWLAYFDSWYVLGLLIAAFVPSRTALIATCLICPWIDERFVLGFPLCFLVRCAVLERFGAEQRGLLRREAAVAALLLGPYLLARALALACSVDPGSKHQLSERLAAVYPPNLVARGIWQGLRGAWAFVLAFLLEVSSGRRLILSGLFILASVATLIVNLFAAGDISRSMSVFMPAALGGVILLSRRDWRTCRIILILALGGALAMPAEHVVASFTIPIRSLAQEIQDFRSPPLYLSAAGYTMRGLNRARRQDAAGALADFSTALRLDPLYYEAQYCRGLLYQRQGDRARAAADLRAVLAHAPADWRLRAQAEAGVLQVGSAAR
jgi:tetratricopeptide (TPR) repeat protein